MTSQFMDYFQKMFEACVPHYETTIRPKSKPYITTEIKRLIRIRDRLHKTYKLNNTETSRYNYTQIRNQVVSKIRQSLKCFEEKQLQTSQSNQNSNLKRYWQALKTKYKIKS